MTVKPIPAAILSPACELLRPYVKGLAPGDLVNALQAHNPDLATPAGPTPVLSLQQLAKLAGVSYFTALREIDRGHLHAQKIGRQWRVTQAEASRYLGQAQPAQAEVEG